ncbi:Auxin-responsive protein SAUR72 [Glycine soja]|uniref:Auxin-responsive protein SAUR72 n=1 Tax=Glycine soja TaxID=3848 RepID=A0A445IIG1_GLYSO|nr:Auxin-responsive protein SAUR72 [Glycine soja]
MEPLTLKKMTHQEDKTKGPLERGRNSVGANTKMKEEEAVSGLIQRRKKKKRCQAKRKKKEEETLSGGRRKKKRCGREMKTRRPDAFSYFSEDRTATAAQDDVREGYFSVLAVKGEETKRFIVGLDYLHDPAFLGLLDKAQEEYGFRQKGALALPCGPQELQKILDGPKA